MSADGFWAIHHSSQSVLFAFIPFIGKTRMSVHQTLALLALRGSFDDWDATAGWIYLVGCCMCGLLPMTEIALSWEVSVLLRIGEAWTHQTSSGSAWRHPQALLACNSTLCSSLGLRSGVSRSEDVSVKSRWCAWAEYVPMVHTLPKSPLSASLPGHCPSWGEGPYRGCICTHH